MHLFKRDYKFAMFWPPDQESVSIMPAHFLDAQEHLYCLKYASIIYQGLVIDGILDLYTEVSCCAAV